VGNLYTGGGLSNDAIIIDTGILPPDATRARMSANSLVFGGSTGQATISFAGASSSATVYSNGSWAITTLFVGDISASGTVSGTIKSFRIPHPLDKTKDLMHSCLEGPEIAVFYRGEGVTDDSGMATVALPDYFESLTRKDGRSVILTELFDEDTETELGRLAASHVKDGKFRVRSEFASQSFYWEVKAVRADVAPLEVTTNKVVRL
jgi:hypothetical protein